MKPLKIKMNYFGPYKDETIDFEKFSQNPLFLITGPTGAGKTTIFDAMTYALFGVSSGDRKPEDMRSDFATFEDTTKVSFWFEHQDKIYLIQRTPTQQRATKRGTGITKSNSTASIVQLDNDDLNKTLELNYTKKSEVDTFIFELLNLTADQFRQIILLPQSKFQKFLTANSGDKEIILRDLFGTKLFLEFSEELKLKNNVLNKERSTKNEQLDNLFTQINWEDNELLKLNEARSLEQRQKILADKLNLQNEVLTKKNIEVQIIEDKITNANDQLNNAKLITESFTQLEQLTVDKTRLLEQKQEYFEKKQLADKYQWVSQRGSLFDQYQKLTAQKDQLGNELKDLTKNENDITKKIAEQLALENELLKDTKKVEDAQINALEIKENLLPLAKHQEKYTTKLEVATLNAKIASENVLNNKQKIVVNNKKLVQLQQDLTQLPDILLTQLDIKNLSDLVEKTNDLNMDVNEIKNKIEILKNKKQSNIQELKDLTKKLEELDKLVLKQKQQQQHLMILQLQNDLVLGQACVVCGSIEHPIVNQKNSKTISDKQIKTAIDELEQKREELENTKVSLAKLNNISDQINKDLDIWTNKLLNQTSEFENNQQELGEFAFKKFDLKIANEFDYENWQEQLSKLNMNLANTEIKQKSINEEIEVLNLKLKDYEKQQLEVETILSKHQASRELAANELADNSIKKTDLKSIKEYQTKLDNLEKMILTYQTTSENIKQQQHQLNLELTSNKGKQETLANQLENTKEDYQLILDNLNKDILKQDKVSDLEDFKILLLDERKNGYSISLENEVTKYEVDVKHNEEQIKNILKKISDKEKPNLLKLKEKLENLKISQKEINELQTKQYAVVDQIKTIAQQIKKIITNLDDNENDILQLNKLTNAIIGKNNQRLPLERYVLQQFLAEILEYANTTYFDQLTQNRYQFYIKQEAGINANRTGLEINVYDNDANKFRTVDTLSGGETFLASLAIALSLAEVIQNKAGGVQIEALFIDEGFGSLDQDTLTKAMDALNTLQQSGRIIGIISHVESMQQQIKQQLKVIKKGDGQSEINYQLV